MKGNSPFLKKIPPGAEVNNVLVGEVDFLDKPVSAFVRLSKATILGDFAEVRLPSRFVFLLLGPKVHKDMSVCSPKKLETFCIPTTTKKKKIKSSEIFRF